MFPFQISDRSSAWKVQDWLTKQQLLSSEEIQALTLITRWKLDPINKYGFSDFTTLVAVADSGIIAVSAFTRQSGEAAFLLLLNSNPDVSPTNLSSCPNWIPTFMQLQGKEYLVAHQADNNVHMWDIQSRISKIVLQDIPWSQLFLISDQVLGCIEMYSSKSGKHKIRILEIGMEQWNLKGILHFFTATGKAGILADICYMEATGGVPCLVMCFGFEKSIEAIEMLGGKRRWKTGTEQLRQELNPVSLCTDHNNVYVADNHEHKLHVLSSEDGTVLRRINLLQYGIVYPSSVRLSKDFLYICHTDITDVCKYQTSKLAIKEDL